MCLSWNNLNIGHCSLLRKYLAPSWPWSHGSWIYNYKCTYTISAYHHWSEFESRSGRSVQHYVIKIYDRSVVFSGYSGCSTNKIDRHDITKILLKVALSTIKQTYKQTVIIWICIERLVMHIICSLCGSMIAYFQS